MFKSIWNFVCKLPVAQYIKPLWKSAARSLVDNEIESLRGQVKAAVAAGGVEKVDALFAALDQRLDAGINALPLPAPIKAAILTADGALDAQLDHARQMVDAAIADRGPGAVDAAFDSAKAVLDARIDAL